MCSLESGIEGGIRESSFSYKFKYRMKCKKCNPKIMFKGNQENESNYQLDLEKQKKEGKQNP